MALDGCQTDTLIVCIIDKNSLLYVLSVCTALHMPAPTADTALTLTVYSVPGPSLASLVEFTIEPGMVTSWPQEVSPSFLY